MLYFGTKDKPVGDAPAKKITDWHSLTALAARICNLVQPGRQGKNPETFTMATTSSALAAAPGECAKCGHDEMYDNRLDKASPSSPDFRCKQCRNPVWLTPRSNGKGTRRTPERSSATNGTGRGQTAQPEEIGPENGADAFGIAWKAYRTSLGAVLAHVVPKLQDAGLKPTASDALAATATLFIAATRGR